MTALQQLLHRRTQFLHRQTWMVLLAIAAVLILPPSFAYAQNTVCSSQMLSDPGGWGNVEQIACITPGVSGTVETDNDSYDGNLNDLTMYGVATEAVVSDYFGNTQYDSGMQYGDTSATGGSPEIVEVPFPSNAYTLTGYASDCTWSANSYSDDYDFQDLCWNNTFPGTSISMQQVPTQSTTLSLTAPSAQSTQGQSETFTVTLNTNGADGEQVELMYGYWGIAGSATLSGGIAEITINTPFPAGVNGIYAVYPGDPIYSPATSNTVTQVVIPAITLSSSANPSGFGQPVTFTANVPNGVSGTVTFYYDTWWFGTGTISGTTATFTPYLLDVGDYSITAVWPGDSNYSAFTSNTITQAVVPATPTVTVSCSPNPANYSPNPTMDGAISICTASVRVGSRSVGGDGYVDFYYNGQHFGGGSLNQYGNISANAFNLCTMPAGSYNVVASYNSYDGYYNPASGSTTLIVQNTSPSPITYAPPPPGTTDYSYTITPPDGASGYAANGNLLSYTDWVNGTWSFGAGGYDSLNRLVSGSSGSGPYQGLQMSWSYDSFGNRTSESFGGSPSISLPTGTTAYYNANNQVTGGSLGYDPAGNVTADNANNYLYDGEGRICAVQDRTFGGMTQYIYDAEGTRVAKGVNTNLNAGCDTSGPTFTLTNTYIIGPSGEQLTETDGNGNWVHTNVFAAGQLLATYSYTDNSHAATDTYFALSDWLGTKRAVVSAGGCGTGYVGLPYGDSLTATNLPGFTQCPDATEHHFTGKERDAESGNDYFGARYYASSMGRFMSPDWSAKEEPVPYAKLDNPQTLNLYAYVRNNSLSRFDADGHESAWDLAKKWLNVVEVKIGVSAGVGTSGQWGVAKYEGHATLIGVEANTALAGAGMDSKLVTGVHGSLSAGPAKATIGAGGELSAANGPSATANANASLGPAQASASASADSSGVHTGASATLNGPEMHEDSKVAGSITFGATVGVGINLTQAGTAWDSTVQDVRAVGAYLNNLLPSSPMSWPTAPPIIPTQ